MRAPHKPAILVSKLRGDLKGLYVTHRAAHFTTDLARLRWLATMFCAPSIVMLLAESPVNNRLHAARGRAGVALRHPRHPQDSVWCGL
jgi:hypothetical protein